MKQWWRALFLAIGVALLWALWRIHNPGLTILVVLICAAALARTLFRAVSRSDSLVAGRDFSLRPFVRFSALAIAFSVAGIVWIALMNRVTPDTYLGVAILIVPFLAATTMSAVYVRKALRVFLHGSQV